MSTVNPPAVVDADADRRFRDRARGLGLDPDARFVGGYVAWEWAHARHLFDDLVEPVRGRAVLELGCNLGATAIVLASLGADVTAIDPDGALVELARDNASRYGLKDRIHLHCVRDTTHLPFARASFDWVACNSVLEYVADDVRPDVLREIDRVLRPSGLVAVIGTSNRVWPRENHSRRLFVNYLPRALGQPCGVTSWSLRAELRDYDDLTRAHGGALYVAMKERMGVSGAKLAALRALSRTAAAVGVSPGALAPTISLVLRKR